jgi:predicted nuclease of predicted toxin-antitoxin system
VKFLADMGIAIATVHWLRAEGHDAIHLHEQGLDQLPDPDIIEKARAEGRILLVHDLDFSQLMALSGARLPSVVTFRLMDMRPESVNKSLTEVLLKFPRELEQGSLLSIREHRIRVRDLPIPE